MRLIKASARSRQKPSSSTLPVFVQVRRRSNCSSSFVFADERLTGTDAGFGVAAVLGWPLLVMGTAPTLEGGVDGVSGGSGVAGAGTAANGTTLAGGISPQLLKTPSGTPAHS